VWDGLCEISCSVGWAVRNILWSDEFYISHDCMNLGEQTVPTVCAAAVIAARTLYLAAGLQTFHDRNMCLYVCLFDCPVFVKFSLLVLEVVIFKQPFRWLE
jgi:hypothetical protein